MTDNSTHDKTGTVTNDKLGAWTRWIAGVFGFLLLILAIGLLYFPPTKITREIDGTGTITKITHTENYDLTIPFSVMFVGGLAFVFFGVQGTYFNKFTFSKDGLSVQNQVADYNNPDAVKENLIEDLKSPKAAQEANEPTPTIDIEEKPAPLVSTTVTRRYIKGPDGQRLQYFTLNEVPPDVIQDVLNRWPLGKGLDVRTFEYATRKPGKGNHKWTIKFQDKDPVNVSYGNTGTIVESET